MTELNPARAGAALFVLGIVWAVALFVVVGTTGTLAGAFVASVGVVLMALFEDPNQDDGPPTADDLEQTHD